MIQLVLASLPALDSPEALPLGAACVAAAVNRSPALRGEVEARILEGRAGEGGEELASRIASAGADWVGFSVYSWSRRAATGAARAIRARFPGALLFAGGPEATADPRSLLEEGGFDFAVVGEGEAATALALAAILECLRESPAGDGASGPRPAAALAGAKLAGRLSALPGIALPGRPFLRAPAEDPALLPSPWLSGTLDPRTRGGDLVWELARGCPYACAYCYESKGERGVRRFPPERIEAELDLFARSLSRYVFVLDPTFNADRERCLELLALMRRRAPGIRWKFELRAELLDGATVARLGALDCVLQVGLQSARPETMAALGRGFDRAAFARGLGMLDRAGLTYGLDLIYGLPGDALRDFESSLDWALGFGPNHLDLFPLSVLPGTALADQAAELGVEADAAPPYLVRATRRMSAVDLVAAADLAAACDRFYSSGRAVGWFRAALAPLRERPSAFLRRYGAWRGRAAAPEAARTGASTPGPKAPAHAEIENEQLAFLEESYRASGMGRLWPALRDLVRLHGAMSRAVAEGETAEIELSHDPDGLLAGAPASLKRFAAAAKRQTRLVVVLPDESEGAVIREKRRGGAGESP